MKKKTKKKPKSQSRSSWGHPKEILRHKTQAVPNKLTQTLAVQMLSFAVERGWMMLNCKHLEKKKTHTHFQTTLTVMPSTACFVFKCIEFNRMSISVSASCHVFRLKRRLLQFQNSYNSHRHNIIAIGPRCWKRASVCGKLSLRPGTAGENTTFLGIGQFGDFRLQILPPWHIICPASGWKIFEMYIKVFATVKISVMI